jgi:phospholipid/cholesterol/gamma-HCH transport system substrate-binding protein
MSHEAKVGLFVIISGVILAVTLAGIANVQFKGGLVRYKAYFTFAGGVERGTVVRFGGRKAGRVAEVRQAPDDPTRVEVQIDVFPTTPVRTDSVASISSLGMLGENYLEITPGKKDAAPLPPGSTIPSIEAMDFSALTRRVGAVADSSQLLIVDLHKNLNQISDKADQLLANLNEITGEKNRQSLEGLLAKSNKMVDDQAPKIDRIVSTLEQTTQKIDSLITELRGTNTKAGDLITNINKTVDETRDPIKKDLEQIQQAVAETQALVEQMRALLAYNDENLNRTLENFRTTSQNLAEFTADVKQRPFSLLRIKPKPDRKVPVKGANGK